MRRYVALYALTNGLEWVISVALMVLVFDQTGSATVAALMLLLANVLPALGVAAGAKVFDRVPAPRLLFIGLLVQGVAIVGVGATAGSLVGLLVFATVVGSAGALVRASVRGGVATAAAGDPDRYRSAMAVVNIVRSITTFAGPALAGVAVGLAGAPSTLLAAGAVALAGALVLPFSRPDTWVGNTDDLEEAGDAAPAASGPAGRPSNAKLVTLLLALGAVVSCAFYMDEPVLLPFSTDDLGAGVPGYTAIFAAWGGGVMIGSALFTRLLDQPMLRVCGFATCGTALAYVALGFAPTLPVALAICVAGGVANGIDWPALAAAIQEAAPQDQQASVAARLESMLTAGPAAGILIGGIVADTASTRFSISLAGVIVLVAVAVGALAYRRMTVTRRGPAFPIPTTALAGGTS